MKLFLHLVVVAATFFSFPLKADNNSPAGCKEGNCFNGYGKYQFANGNRYVGEFIDGKPHGNGILFCANGNKYLGSWQASLRQGQGKYIFMEGHEYTGSFHRNNFHGKGKMEYANGDVYKGNWQANLPNGDGIYSFKKGGRYEGGFLEGRFHGKGIMFYKDGAKFAGHWLQSKKHGLGTYTNKNGVSQQGEWVNGRSIDIAVVEKNEEQTMQPGQPDEGKKYLPDSSEESVIIEAAESSVRIWATVVGVASYAHMPSLRYTDDDAYQFYAFLKSPEGGALPDEQVQVLVDDNATKENILNSMRNTLLNADENDVVLFYFSGHGVEGAFIPVDFDGFENRLYHHEIRQILDEAKAKHKIVLGDACHAGSLYGEYGGEEEIVASRSTVNNMLDQYYSAFENTNGGTALLMSSKGQEVSLEDSGLRSGVFSHFLIRGLKGEADFNHDNIVTIDEVFQFTLEKVSGYTVGAQTPVLIGEYDETMPVSVVRE